MSLCLDGFPTLLQINGLSLGTKIKEKEVTPFGIDGGGGHDTTTMRNVLLETTQPGKLHKHTPLEFTAAYDPVVFAELEAITNINALQIIQFPDVDQTLYHFFGFLDKVKPNPCKNNEQPTMTLTVVLSDQDNNGNEFAPN